MFRQASQDVARLIRKASRWMSAVLFGAAISVAGSSAVAQEGVIDGELLRDPTQPAHLAAVSAGDSSSGMFTQVPDRGWYVLSFIRTGGDYPIAVINDQSLSVGDRVGEAVVRDIRPTEVILVIGGRELVLSTISLPVRESVN